MKKYFSYFFVILILLVANLFSEAQEPTYSVNWSNEKILPYEDVSSPTLSPAGDKIVFLRQKAVFNEIWTISSNGSEGKSLLAEKYTDYDSPIWFPDGSRILFLQNGNYELWSIKADGTGKNSMGDKKLEKFNPLFLGSDEKKIVIGLLGIDPPGVYMLDYVHGTQKLLYSTKTLSTLNPPFTVSPDGITILILQGQELIFLNIDGTLKEKRIVTSLMGRDSNPIFSPNGKYIILDNVLYDLTTSKETVFLPDTIVRYKEFGKPELVGPRFITLSKDGKKIAFVMEDSNTRTYRARIKVMDLIWK